MIEHPDEQEVPDFKFRILGVFKDCLSRQVSEAMRIHSSQDHLLNSKNEYSSNCLTRLVVDEDKFEKKRKQKMEEQEENEEQRR